MLIIPIYYVSRSNTTSNIQLDDVRIKEENRKRLAIMVKENDNEDYKSYNGNTWPINYIYKRSECIDSNGTITNVDVKYENNNIIINTSKTVYCTIYFDKDTKEPTINELYIISNPTPLYTNTSTGKVNVTMTWEDSDVSSYCISTSATTSDSCTWEPTSENQITKEIQLNEGRNNIYGYIKDKAENISGVKEGSIILDRQAPTITEESTKPTVINETDVTITVVASDVNSSLAVSGVKQICYGMKDTNTVSDFTCINYNASGTTFKIDKDGNNAALKAETTYTYYVYAIDNAGNGTMENRTSLTFTTIKSAGTYIEEVVADNSYSSTGVEDDPLVKRFYGLGPNNYICFGTSTNCWYGSTSNTNFQYRIIGATSDGKLKIMKQIELSKKLLWHTDNGATWETSKLRNDINGSLFYNDSILVPLDWKKYIYQNPSWCMGDIASVTNNTRGSEALTQEMATCKTIANSPIGLMYLSDYYFAYDGKGNNGCYSITCNNWMTYISTQWTMTRMRDNAAWSTYDTTRSYVSGYAIDAELAIRPVFYLVSNIKLSGSGGQGDPFIIEGLA